MQNFCIWMCIFILNLTYLKKNIFFDSPSLYIYIYNRSHMIPLSLWMQWPIRGVQMSHRWNTGVLFSVRSLTEFCSLANAFIINYVRCKYKRFSHHTRCIIKCINSCSTKVGDVCLIYNIKYTNILCSDVWITVSIKLVTYNVLLNCYHVKYK